VRGTHVLMIKDLRTLVNVRQSGTPIRVAICARRTGPREGCDCQRGTRERDEVDDVLTDPMGSENRPSGVEASSVERRGDGAQNTSRSQAPTTLGWPVREADRIPRWVSHWAEPSRHNTHPGSRRQRDNELDPVSLAELGEEPGHMGLHGCLAYLELRRSHESWNARGRGADTLLSRGASPAPPECGRTLVPESHNRARLVLEGADG